MNEGWEIVAEPDTVSAEVDTLKLLPIRFRRDPAELAGIDPDRGTMRAKHPGAYYLFAYHRVVREEPR